VRFLRPSIAIFCLALLASLCIHLPVYEALGQLASVLLRAPAADKAGIVELELAPLAPTPAPAPPPKLSRREAKAKAEAEAKKQKEPELKKPPAPQPDAKKQPQLAVQPPVPVQPVPVEVVPAPPVQPLPTPADRPLAVRQKTDNPNETKPDNAHFIAEENRRVEEETVARIRNMQRDDTPTASAGPTKPDDDEGNANKTDIADQHDVKGSNERPPTEREAARKPDRPSQDSAGQRNAEAAPRPSGQDSAPPSREVTPARASGAPLAGGEPETIVINDGSGSFRIRKLPPGQGPGAAGGAQQPGKASNVRNNRAGQRAQAGANLRLSFAQFEQTFGADELAAQREAYLAQRRSAAAGHGHQKSWKEFRAALENFVPNVRPGDQTALNAAADPFASYLADVHRRIHRVFAYDFLENLPVAGGPFGDYSLHTELEIVINGDGSVQQVGIAETSGFLPFDYGAYNSVMRAAPYPVPPRKILSGDGRVYVRWGFYRNERQCGTFNARPYILPHPPGTPKPGQGPLHDPGDRQGGPAVPATGGDGQLGLHWPTPKRARLASADVVR
jgi:hypothetical protein